jgi:hypothetical protein
VTGPVPFRTPAGGLTVVAPMHDACEGDACVIPAHDSAVPEGSASFLGGDVPDRRVEG